MQNIHRVEVHSGGGGAALRPPRLRRAARRAGDARPHHGRVVDATQAALPGATVTVTDVERGTATDVVDQRAGAVPGQLPACPATTRSPSSSPASRPTSRRTSAPADHRDQGPRRSSSRSARVRGVGQRHRRDPRAQHHGREPRPRRRPGAPRVAAADPRRPVQDHGARHRPRALGQPASRPPVRAHAHRRLRLPGHAQQPQRPADRRRAEHRDRQRQRGHRDLRAAVGPRAGIQGADGDVRRAVRQHRGRRHQHRHQVGHEPVQGHGLLLRRAVQAGRQRLLRQGPGTGHRRELVGPARLHHRRARHHPQALQRQGQDVLHVRLRAHQGHPAALRRGR